MSRVAEILGPSGVLSRALPGYEPRASQLRMAEEVASVLSERRTLLVEAGTGTGKTLAYLVPAILSGMKVIVSTGTKNLQEQIYRKDIPLLHEHLPVSFSAANIKGLSNYLCKRKFKEHAAREASLGRMDKTLDEIVEWADRTETGDRAELAHLEDDSEIWSSISPTVETRLGPRCPHFEECFVTRARRNAQGADVVIVNHHLFFADLALKSSWAGAQLLPTYDAVIFDEAHQLEDIATDFFGRGVSSLRLHALARDTERGLRADTLPEKLSPIIAHVQKRADDLFTELGRTLRDGARGDARTVMTKDTWAQGNEKRAHALDTSLEELEHALGEDSEDALALARRAHAIRDDLALVVDGAQRFDSSHVFWAETRGRTVLLHASPVDVAEKLRETLLANVDAAIFTSATLTSEGNFEFVRGRLGLDAAKEARLPSPFDYATQAVLYLPSDLPEPREDSFAERAAERIQSLVEITDGRAFLLFTSHRQMQRVHGLLKGKLGNRRVLLQGERPKHLLVEEFRAHLGSVLFATQSFWEGVDVAGEALSLVVIDKLPFAPPDDPLVAARSRRLEEQGQDPFARYQVPRAALSLAQGFGRLIRHRQDRGIVALLDRRASQKGYGKRVLASLPPECMRTDSIEEVRAFWARRARA